MRRQFRDLGASEVWNSQRRRHRHGLLTRGIHEFLEAPAESVEFLGVAEAACFRGAGSADQVGVAVHRILRTVLSVGVAVCMNARLYDSKRARRGPRQGPPRERTPPLLRPSSAGPGVGALPTSHPYRGLALGLAPPVSVDMKADRSWSAAPTTQDARLAHQFGVPESSMRALLSCGLCGDPSQFKPSGPRTAYRVPAHIVAAIRAEMASGHSLGTVCLVHLTPPWPDLGPRKELTDSASTQDPKAIIEPYPVEQESPTNARDIAPLAPRNPERQSQGEPTPAAARQQTTARGATKGRAGRRTSVGGGKFWPSAGPPPSRDCRRVVAGAAHGIGGSSNPR